MLFEMWTGGSGESLQTMLTLETQYGICLDWGEGEEGEEGDGIPPPPKKKLKDI